MPIHNNLPQGCVGGLELENLEIITTQRKKARELTLPTSKKVSMVIASGSKWDLNSDHLTLSLITDKGTITASNSNGIFLKTVESGNSYGGYFHSIIWINTQGYKVTSATARNYWGDGASVLQMIVEK